MAERVVGAEELLQRYAQGERDFGSVDLREAILNEADLRWADLRGADLRAAKLRGAKLWGADLSEADLSEADLAEANLSGIDLREAVLCGTNLRKAYLNRARLSGADLRRADLSETNLSGARLSGADLRNASLGDANLSNAHLDQAKLSEAYLRQADLTGVMLTGADLRAANLRKADLRQADLREVDLSEADLREADLRGVDLRGVDLTFPKLQGADLRETNLRAHDLRGVDLCFVNLRGVDLSDADLRFAKLEDAELSGAVLDGCALGPSADLLVASWQTLTINGTSYVRSAVERGEQVLPIGQPEPLRFVFSVDGELDGDDLQVVREVVRGLKHARGTKAKLEVSEGNDVLCVEGFGSRKQAGQGGILLLLVRHAIREGIRGSASEPPPGKQPEHGQLLLALAHSLLEDAAVVQLVDRLELREIELRSTEEVVEFEQLVQDRHLTRRVTIVGRTVRLAKAFAPVPKARELLLSFLGLEPVARAFKAAVDRVRRGATG